MADTSRVKYFDVVIDHGKGATITDADGRDYIDLLASASATNTGHSHPHVVADIAEQAEKLIQYTPAYFANTTTAKLTQRLAKLAPGQFEKQVVFGNSGSDANDAIIKFARAYTGRQYIVSFTGAYHGSTYGAISISGVSLNMTRKIGPLLPEVVKVPFPDQNQRLENESDDDFSERLFKQFKLPFETYLPADDVALVIIEPIQGDGGIVKAPQKYMDLVYQFTRDHGIVFAVDEVNQGLGRTGKLWSIDHFGIAPDLMSVGKSIASGLPLSAVIGRREIMASLSAPANVYTTAGNPVTAAAAMATLDVIETEKLVARSERIGNFAKAFFEKAAEFLNAKYGAGTVTAVVKDSYYNMKEKIEPHMELIHIAENAMRKNGVTPVISPVRGGTDGARLSYMGLPCPNLCTGGHNYHGKYEYVCVESMEQTVNILTEIVKSFGVGKNVD